MDVDPPVYLCLTTERDSASEPRVRSTKTAEAREVFPLDAPSS